MDTSILSCRIGVLFYLVTAVAGVGQVAASSQTIQQVSSSPATEQVSQNQATLQAFQQEQRALARQERALEAGGATPQQLAAWHQENSAQFAAQEQRAEAMAITSALSLRRQNRQPRIPADASPALKDLLTTQAALANARAQIHNQLVQQATASGQSPTFAQVGKMEQQESQLFQQQNAAVLALQTQRSQVLANASAQTMRTVPAPLVIPSNATPQMAAYLTTRNQIRRGLVQIRNQYATATPAAREAAMQEWFKQNAGLIAQLRQQAQSLSQANTTTPN
jgi:hypothetical protein